MPAISAVFKSGRARSKHEQESDVSAYFEAKYGQITGTPLKRVHCEQDPPDLIYECANGHHIGVELFELFQNYEFRAFKEQLINAVYAEFESQVPSALLTGKHISLACQHSGIAVKERFLDLCDSRGVKSRKVVAQFAREFVDAAKQCMSTKKEIPNTLPNQVPGLLFRIPKEKYPVLSAFGECLWLVGAPEHDPRRSDGKAAPLVVLGGSAVNEQELDSFLTEWIARKIRDKVSSLPRWPNVERTILIVHDFPRGHFYEGVGKAWEKWLQPAILKANTPSGFNEIWLVTGRSIFEIEVIPVLR